MRALDLPSYFVTAVLAVLMSWMVAGCKFGNSVQYAESPDQLTGYYEMRPQSVRLFLQLDGETGAREGQHPPSQIPYPIGAITTNPVILYMQDLKQGYGLLISALVSNPTDGLPIAVQNNTRLVTDGQSNLLLAWNDPACTRQYFFSGTGSIDPSIHTTFSSITTRGRIQMDLNFYYTITPQEGATSCDASLTAMAQCLQNVNACLGESADERQQVQEVQRLRYQPFLDAHLLTFEEFPRLRGFGFDVSYE